MKISKFLYLTTTLAIDALSKASKTNQHIKGMKNTKNDHPIRFKVTHFTRQETMLLADTLHKKTENPTKKNPTKNNGALY